MNFGASTVSEPCLLRNDVAEDDDLVEVSRGSPGVTQALCAPPRALRIGMLYIIVQEGACGRPYFVHVGITDLYHFVPAFSGRFGGIVK